MKLIAIDIGNSSINIGFFIGSGIVVRKIDTNPLLSFEQYSELFAKFMRENYIDKLSAVVIISSVAPSHTDAVAMACKTLTGKEPFILSLRLETETHKLKTGISFQISEPEKLGTDRLAASAGACDLFGAPVAVVDFGTATTLNFIAKGNAYKGGAIMPGIMLMKSALADKTAQLPNIEISMPLSPLGKDTRENILSGIIYGTAGAVERIINEGEKTLQENFKVVVTGGYSEFAAPFIKRVDYIEPFLVLKGLKFIYERSV